MKRLLLLLALTGALTLIAINTCNAEGEPAPSTVTITAAGEAAMQGDAAAAQSEAVWSAKRNAVEQAGGLLLRSATAAADYKIVNQVTTSTVQGFIKSWRLIPDSVKVRQLAAPLQGAVISLRIVAVVDIQPIAKNLRDLQDAYNDLNRPSIWVIVASSATEGAAACTEARATITSWLKAQGYSLAADQHDAAVVLRIHVMPNWSINMGASNTPYGLGSQISSCTVVFTWRVLETASQMVLESGSSSAKATSFASNSASAAKATLKAASSLQSNPGFTSTLLARWAAERYSGYVASIQIVGLPSRLHQRLIQQISTLRGFMGVRDEESQDGVWTIHARFRQALSTLNNNIASLKPGDNFRIRSIEKRGSLMLFRADRRER